MIGTVRFSMFLLLLAGTLGIGSCGERAAPPGHPGTPGPSGPAGLPGTYVVDREATKAALLAAAAALDDPEIRARMELPVDPELRSRRIATVQRNQRKLAEAVRRGEVSQELTVAADGTWTGKTVARGRTQAFSGTWTRQGDVLTMKQESPPSQSARTCRFRSGNLEILGHGELVVAVLKREGGTPNGI